MNNDGVATAWPPMVRAFSYRNFRLLFAGQLLSTIGTWIQNLALSWLVFKLTQSPAMLGLTSFANQFPGFLLAPLTGMVADRFDRRKVMFASELLSFALAFLLAILTLTHQVQIWQILTIGALLGAAASFEIPARHALVSEIVARSDLSNAIALSSTIFNTSRIIGPAIAGVLVVLVGEGWCFMINAASFLPIMISVLLLRMEPRQRAQLTGNIIGAITEGFRYFAATPPLRYTVISTIGLSLFGNLFTTLLPVFAANILQGGADTLGILMGSAGFGALCGALILASRRGHGGLIRWVGFGTIGIGALLVAFSLSSQLYFSVPLLACVGASWVFASTSANTLFQSLAPDELRGRAVSIYLMIMMGGTPLGGLMGGTVAELAGAPLALGGAGAICCLIGIWYQRKMARTPVDLAAS